MRIRMDETGEETLKKYAETPKQGETPSKNTPSKGNAQQKHPKQGKRPAKTLRFPTINGSGRDQEIAPTEEM